MTPAVLDTDPGIDDALALLLAWSSPELEVEALTTVAGNVPVKLATLNALRLCALRQPSRRPIVAEGATAPLRRPLRTATHYHGLDGLGDAPGWTETRPLAVAPSAVDVLLERAALHRDRLAIVALGPLTNLAQALARDATVLRGVGRIVVMGGAVDVPGNVTPEAEFNIHVDPDAARIVFDAGLSLTLVPLDATRQVLLTRGELEAALARCPGPLAARVMAFTARAFGAPGTTDDAGVALHDPLAVGVAIDPTFCAYEDLRLVIGADGETRRTPGAPNCRVAMRVDRARFMRTFLDRLCPSAP